MRLSRSSLAIAMTAASIAGAAHAAEIDIPQHPPPKQKELWMQNGPPNCSRWSDGCTSCARGAGSEPMVCSNTGFSCQPKMIRCIQP
ncbi:MAG: hypothetical protein BGO16_09310 [Nitrobacter sp. 62-23]|nr:MAG: hypothetical protein BGO16_09310 [Nitrobacter sp. 62-23]